MNQDIIHENNKFSKIIDGLETVLEYEMYGNNTVVFYHTYVPFDLRGRGLAKEIIRVGLEWARQENYKVIPACSAVKRYIDLHPEYQLTLV